MSFVEVLLIGIGLSMDAFAVSICKGLAMKKIKYGHSFIIALFFGVFQAGMPILGWTLASKFADLIKDIDHWIAFILLGGLGLKMIIDGIKDEAATCPAENDLNIKELFVLAIATSIDAMAVGISFAFLKVDIISPAIMIGITTFAISFMGVALGHVFGTKLQQKSVIVGGIILIGIGIKILIEHLTA